MKSLSNALAGAPFAGSANPDAVNPGPVMAETVSQIREDWRQARAAHGELVAMGMPRVNLLLSGRDTIIENLLEALLPHLREPIGRWQPGEQLLLPPPTLIGTMIFQDIDGMPMADQNRLVVWLDEAAGRTQVVTTTRSPLYNRVEAGDFLETLYYRLNTLCLDLSD
jgi:hypothetical protein